MQPLHLPNTPNERRKKRGNPNWGNGTARVAPAALTEFDLLLQDIGVNPEFAHLSPIHPAVRKFVRQHKSNRYIPEPVLVACGIRDTLEVF